MFTRVALLAGFALAASACSARAADLPTGTWSVNVNGTKGELVIKEVGADGKVTLTIFNSALDGHWDGKTLTFSQGPAPSFEGYLISEPAEKGQTKYTLTGVVRNPPLTIGGQAVPEFKTGWYAHMIVKPAAAQLKGEGEDPGPGSSTTDLPTGTWTVNVAGKTGELIIKEVIPDKTGSRTVKLTLFGTESVGYWTRDLLTFTIADEKKYFEAYLVSEPAEKGQTKYTLVGSRTDKSGPPALGGGNTVGWYAQIVVKPSPPGQIKVEVKGTLVCKDTTGAYVSVKQPDGPGREEETRVYFWLTKGELKYWRDVLPKLNGQTVTVTGAVSQLPKGTQTSIPEGAVYFHDGFTIKTATETFP